MKLILNNGTIIESVTANQKLIIIPYADNTELASIRLSMTDDNLAGAEVDTETGVLTVTYTNKVIAGATNDCICKKITYNLADSAAAEVETLQAAVTQLQTEKNELQTICVENSLALCEVYELLLGSNEDSSEDSSDDTESEENTESEGDTE